MRAAGVPIIPGAVDPVRSAGEVAALGAEIGYPLIVKAAAGGGGKGMEIVASRPDAERAFEAAASAGREVLRRPDGLRRALPRSTRVTSRCRCSPTPTATSIHLGERDCTIQRRHQKLVEETPSPAVDAALRERIGGIAVDAARAAGYRSAGTIEGLLTARGRLLLHGDEHAHPGRAHGDRGRHRARPRPGAGADRRRRAALRVAGRGRAPRARDRVPDQRRGRLRRLPAGAGPDHPLRRAGWAGCPGRLRRRGGRRGQRAVRPARREADRPRRRPGARDRAHAPSARGVSDRGPSDAARLPRGPARASVLRRRGDLPRGSSSRMGWRRARRSSRGRSPDGEQVRPRRRTDRSRPSRGWWAWRSRAGRTTSAST